MARGQSQTGAESTSRLVALKAVEAGYPLRGELKVASSLVQAQLALSNDSPISSPIGSTTAVEKISTIPAKARYGWRLLA